MRAMQHFKEGVLAKPVNISEVAYRAILTGHCTYLDLNTRLGLEDALNIIEIDQVAKHNEDTMRYIQEQTQNGG